MFYFDKESENVIFCDNRELDAVLCDGRTLNIHPDVVADFRNIPFPDGRFNLVVFDPPHIDNLGSKSWMALKYGVLSENWREDLRQGFSECMRVLKPGGVLIMKWNEDRIKISEVLKAVNGRPLFGHQPRSGKTVWTVYMKEVTADV
jgi:SAM-dependent methyltransferase